MHKKKKMDIKVSSYHKKEKKKLKIWIQKNMNGIILCKKIK